MYALVALASTQWELANERKSDNQIRQLPYDIVRTFFARAFVHMDHGATISSYVYEETSKLDHARRVAQRKYSRSYSELCPHATNLAHTRKQV